jgi:hypothetical protein
VAPSKEVNKIVLRPELTNDGAEPPSQVTPLNVTALSPLFVTSTYQIDGRYTVVPYGSVYDPANPIKLIVVLAAIRLS